MTLCGGDGMMASPMPMGDLGWAGWAQQPAAKRTARASRPTPPIPTRGPPPARVLTKTQGNMQGLQGR
jgi:hypothetical protein